MALEKALSEARDAYQNSGEQYEESTRVFQQQIIYPVLVILLAKQLKVMANKVLLDLGCGSGNLVRMLTNVGSTVSGLELTPRFVEMATTKGLNVREGSMHHIPWPDGNFDGVVSNFAINYLPHNGQFACLKETARVLKPRGVAVFSWFHPWFMRNGRFIPDPPHYPTIGADYFQPVKEIQIPMFGQNFRLFLSDWPEIANMAIAAGLNVLELKDLEKPQNLEEIAQSVQDAGVRQMLLGLNHNPIAAVLVARKR